MWIGILLPLKSKLYQLSILTPVKCNKIRQSRIVSGLLVRLLSLNELLFWQDYCRF